MHSIVYSYCPTSLRQIFQRNDQREISQNLRNENEFTIPYPRIEMFKKSLLYRLPTEWNALADLKFQHNRVTFEIGLKEHLLSLIHNEQSYFLEQTNHIYKTWAVGIVSW
jgi:hypothetical protein